MMRSTINLCNQDCAIDYAQLGETLRITVALVSNALLNVLQPDLRPRRLSSLAGAEMLRHSPSWLT